jgi:hypothetical protein
MVMYFKSMRPNFREDAHRNLIIWNSSDKLTPEGIPRGDRQKGIHPIISWSFEAAMLIIIIITITCALVMDSTINLAVIIVVWI